MPLTYTEFVRKPFVVEAIEVTTENIEELAPLIGQLKHEPNGRPYIRIDRRVVPNIEKVFAGFWLTRMDDNYRCYSKKIFKQQFTENTAEISDWVNFLNDTPANNIKTNDFAAKGADG